MGVWGVGDGDEWECGCGCVCVLVGCGLGEGCGHVEGEGEEGRVKGLSPGSLWGGVASSELQVDPTQTNIHYVHVFAEMYLRTYVHSNAQ